MEEKKEADQADLQWIDLKKTIDNEMLQFSILIERDFESKLNSFKVEHNELLQAATLQTKALEHSISILESTVTSLHKQLLQTTSSVKDINSLRTEIQKIQIQQNERYFHQKEKLESIETRERVHDKKLQSQESDIAILTQKVEFLAHSNNSVNERQKECKPLSKSISAPHANQTVPIQYPLLGERSYSLRDSSGTTLHSYSTYDAFANHAFETIESDLNMHEHSQKGNIGKVSSNVLSFFLQKPQVLFLLI